MPGKGKCAKGAVLRSGGLGLGEEATLNGLWCCRGHGLIMERVRQGLLAYGCVSCVHGDDPEEGVLACGAGCRGGLSLAKVGRWRREAALWLEMKEIVG